MNMLRTCAYCVCVCVHTLVYVRVRALYMHVNAHGIVHFEKYADEWMPIHGSTHTHVSVGTLTYS